MLKKSELKKYFKPKNFINRDISWIEFNRRVLEEALNPSLPLLDQIKFISIFFTNLDEFYMIRVSGLKGRIRSNISEPAIDGLTPIQELIKIEYEIREMLNLAQDYWNNTILNKLSENHINIIKYENLPAKDKKALSEYFRNEIYPVLTPLAFDPGRPFPYISNLSLSFAILVKNPSGEKHFARVKIPNNFNRFINLDGIIPNGQNHSGKFSAKFIWIEELIKHNLGMLFTGFEIVEAHLFRITRDTDLAIQEDEADDLLELMEENVKQRKFGFVVRLEVEKNMPQYMVDTLTENLEINERDLHITDGPVGLSNVIELYNLPQHHLKEKPFNPVIPKDFEDEENIFSIIKRKDVLVHHPYESFSPVVKLIEEAARDPEVLGIKQTLYRVGANSPIVEALIEAAERKKQVAVLVELKARFDEENNIFWAKELEKAGVHVVYGLLGLKTHAKMTLIIRKEPEGLNRYVHLGTGNYNPETAKIYSDLGLFTADKSICSDVSELFNFLTGYSQQNKYRKLLVAPLTIRTGILSLIENEINNANRGNKAHIIMKLNSLVDPHMISAFYEASCAGVKIDLIVRGICCLRPGVKDISSNITVRSIVGRFLEHSRIFYFYNNGNEDVFVGSADLMPRNLDRRVEILFPIQSTDIKNDIIQNVLFKSLSDNIKARLMLPDGKYEMANQDDKTENISVQEWLMDNSIKRS